MGEKEVVALAFCTFLLGVAVLVVGVRVFVRRRELRKEDAFCGVAAALYVLDIAFLFLGVKYGFGKRIEELHDARNMVNWRQIEYMSFPPYYIGLMFIKMAILCQYRRFVSKHIRTLCHILLAVVIATTLSFVLLSAFQCSPVRGFWDYSERRQCKNLKSINFAFLSVNAGTNVVLLLVPAFTVRKFQLHPVEKQALVVVFVLGGFATLTSILRIHPVTQMRKPPAISYPNFQVAVWMRIETGLSLLCASIPGLRTLLAKRLPQHWGTLQSSQDSIRKSREHRRRPGMSRLNSGDMIGNEDVKITALEFEDRSHHHTADTPELDLTQEDKSFLHISQPISRKPSLRRSQSVLKGENGAPASATGTGDEGIRVTTVTRQTFASQELRVPESVAQVWSPSGQARNGSPTWAGERRRSGFEGLGGSGGVGGVTTQGKLVKEREVGVERPRVLFN